MKPVLERMMQLLEENPELNLQIDGFRDDSYLGLPRRHACPPQGKYNRVQEKCQWSSKMIRIVVNLSDWTAVEIFVNSSYASNLSFTHLSCALSQFQCSGRNTFSGVARPNIALSSIFRRRFSATNGS